MKTYSSVLVTSALLAMTSMTACNRLNPLVPTNESSAQPAADLSLNGRVMDAASADDGTGVEGVEVTLTRGEVARTATTGPDGSFAIDGLTAGEWVLSISHPDYAKTVQTVEIDGSQTITVLISRDGETSRQGSPVPLGKARVSRIK
jgi:Carboxypeptidase regulatory-like domain